MDAVTDWREGTFVGVDGSVLEQLHRTVDYVASWDGETTPAVDECPECVAHA